MVRVLDVHTSRLSRAFGCTLDTGRSRNAAVSQQYREVRRAARLDRWSGEAVVSRQGILYSASSGARRVVALRVKGMNLLGARGGGRRRARSTPWHHCLPTQPLYGMLYWNAAVCVARAHLPPKRPMLSALPADKIRDGTCSVNLRIAERKSHRVERKAYGDLALPVHWADPCTPS